MTWELFLELDRTSYVATIDPEKERLNFSEKIIAILRTAWIPEKKTFEQPSRMLEKAKNMVLAELWRPEGPPSRSSYSYGKQKETHELIFSWLLWLAVLRTHDGDGDGVTLHGGHTTNNSLTEICSLGSLCTSLILDINVMINWHLSKQGIHWPVSLDRITGSSLQLIEVNCFFEVDRWPSAGVSIGSWAPLWLTCWKQGRIVRKTVNANPVLKVNRIITFSSIQLFLLLCFVYMVIIETENRRPNNI